MKKFTRFLKNCRVLFSPVLNPECHVVRLDSSGPTSARRRVTRIVRKRSVIPSNASHPAQRNPETAPSRSPARNLHRTAGAVKMRRTRDSGPRGLVDQRWSGPLRRSVKRGRARPVPAPIQYLQAATRTQVNDGGDGVGLSLHWPDLPCRNLCSGPSGVTGPA